MARAGRPPAVAAVVLAAGAGRRFGGDKLLAELDGMPLLQHVLDRLAEAGLDDPVVVVAPDYERRRGRLDLRSAHLVVNPNAADGLASSLRVGWRAALATMPRPSAVLIALGDQPRVRPEVCSALLTAPLDPARPVLAPRYRDGGGANPLRLETSAGALVDAAAGDRGLGPIIAASPELVRWLDVEGSNPDVDEPANLVRLERH